MTGLRRAARRIALLAAVTVASVAFAPPADPHPAIATVGSVAEQLGVKVNSRADDEFTVGTQFTGNLVDAGKLASWGIKGMHPGARVVAARIAPDRVYVEADELDPPARASVRLPLDASGNIVRPPRV